MFEELINEIEKIKKNKVLLHYVDCPQNRETIQLITEGHNTAIDEIIEVIKASEPQWFDEPNELNCFWWLKRKSILIVAESISLDCVFVTDKFDHDGKRCFWDVNSVGCLELTQIDNVKGKWIKAIVPEIKSI